MKRLFAFIFLPLFLLYFVSIPFQATPIIPENRKIDWTYAGIPSSIPERNVICPVDLSEYGDGKVDATSAIQNALYTCPDDTVIYLPAGKYLISKTIWMHSHDILRGAGQGLTILKHTGTDTGAMISIQDNSWNDLIGSPQTHSIVKANKDEKTLMLADTIGISVGDVLLLNQLNAGDITSYGTNGKCTFCGLSNGDRSLGQFVEVIGINKNQVSINVPLHWTYDTNLTPWAYRVAKAHMSQWVGIEDITITQDTAVVRDTIFIQGAQYSWIRNVEISNIYSNGIFTYYLLQSEITGNYLHNGIGSYGNSMAYGITLTQYSSNNRIENNIIDTLSNGGIETHGGASGNVIAYNYLHNITYSNPNWLIASPGVNHGSHPKMNLWEGNIGYMAVGDFIWGSSSYNTIFRSQLKGWQSDAINMNNAAIRLEKDNYDYNIIGNILGTPNKSNTYEFTPGQQYSNANLYIYVLGYSTSISGGMQDAKVAETLYRHGNFDYVTNSVVWNANNSNHNLPASLYLSQKPSWWCNEVPWPGIGPDVNGYVNAIPAERRFENLSCTQGSIETETPTPTFTATVTPTSTPTITPTLTPTSTPECITKEYNFSSGNEMVTICRP